MKYVAQIYNGTRQTGVLVCSEKYEVKRRKAMKFDRSACIEPMYSEIPFLDRFQAAKDDGFEYVEFWSWTDKDLDAVKAAA